MAKLVLDTIPSDAGADNLPRSWPAEFLSSIIETQSDIAAVELDTGIVMQIIVERTRALTGADGAAIDVVDGQHVICRAASGLGEMFRGRGLAVESSLSGRTARRGELFHSGNISIDPAADDVCRSLDARSVVYVPLAYNGQVVGVLRMLSQRQDAFDAQAVASLRLMAGLLAAALEHAGEFEVKKKLLAERTEALARLRESEERFRSACEYAPIGMAIVGLDGRWIEVNRSLCRIVGYDPDELLAKDFQSITHPDDLTPDLHNVDRLLSGRSDSYQMLKRYIRKDRRVVWVLLSVSLVKDSAGKPKYFIAQVQDITQRQLAEWLEEDRRRALEMVAKDQPLQQVLVQLAVALERQMSDSVAAVLLLQDGQITVHGTDRSAAWLAGLRYRSLPRAMELSAHFWSAPDACGYTDLRADEPWKELRAEAAEAGLRACWTMPVTATDGAMMGMILVFSSQSRRPSAEERIVIDSISQLATLCIEHQNTTRQLAHLVRHDSLTSLPNRLLFEDRVQQALALSRRTGNTAALMVLDVDNFKTINDSLGHHAGDHLLQQFAYRLRARLRESDTMARVGGDEFAIILPEIPGSMDAEVVAKKLLAALAEPFDLAERSIRVTASIGVAIYEQEDDPTSLQKRADAALYRVKARGRNGYSL